MVVHRVPQDEYIPVKFAETILNTIIKPQEENLEAIKQLTKSINDLLTLVSVPPSHGQLYEAIIKNREVIVSKIDECIKTLDMLLEKRTNTITDNEKETLIEIKRLFENNRQIIENLKSWYIDKGDLYTKEFEDKLEDTFLDGSPLYIKLSKITSDIEDIKHHNKVVLTIISVTFSIIMAAITYVTMVAP